jgi:DNA-binding CsgD family transcriptional regulator
MKLRVYVGVRDAARRRQLVELLRRDAEVALVGEPGEADVVLDDAAAHAGPMAAALEAEEGTALTAREREVFRLMAEGLVNRRIAAELGISSHTVKYHVASVLTKLGAHTRAEAVSRGLREGLLPL